MRLGLLVFAVLLPCATTATAQSWGTVETSASRPRRVKSVKASYTPEAKAAQIQGWVDLEAVVLPDGTVGDAQVIESCLGRIGAHREPNGKPVVVRIVIRMNFDFRDKSPN